MSRVIALDSEAGSISGAGDGPGGTADATSASP